MKELNITNAVINGEEQPAVRAIRPCDEVRQAYKRYVVFK
jgi:hypothetical protein